MNGMQMMLKSMGFDPDAITAQINGYGEIIKAFGEAMKRIEAKQSVMEATLARIEAKLDGKEITDENAGPGSSGPPVG